MHEPLGVDPIMIQNRPGPGFSRTELNETRRHGCSDGDVRGEAVIQRPLQMPGKRIAATGNEDAVLVGAEIAVSVDVAIDVALQ